MTGVERHVDIQRPTPAVEGDCRVTFVWLLVYVPLETYITWSIAGLRGFGYSSYIMNVVGMGLMLWGAVSARRQQPFGPALLATGWSWTAATFWRATSDRYWWVSQGSLCTRDPWNFGWRPFSRRWRLRAWSHRCCSWSDPDRPRNGSPRSRQGPA